MKADIIDILKNEKYSMTFICVFSILFLLLEMVDKFSLIFLTKTELHFTFVNINNWINFQSCAFIHILSVNNMLIP